jgi:hypothetical protein
MSAYSQREPTRLAAMPHQAIPMVNSLTPLFSLANDTPPHSVFRAADEAQDVSQASKKKRNK